MRAVTVIAKVRFDLINCASCGISLYFSFVVNVEFEGLF